MKTKAALLLLPLLTGGCIYIEPPIGFPDLNNDTRADKPAPERKTYPRYPYPSEDSREARTHLMRSADGKCVDHSRSGYKGMITYPCHGEPNQQFTLSRNRIMVEGQCLDIAGGRTEDGTPVIAYACHGGKNQQWYRDGRTIRSALNGKCLDAGKHGNQIRMYRCDGSIGQRFNFSRY